MSGPLPVRATDPQTSKVAALLAVASRPTVRPAILTIMSTIGKPLTMDEIHEMLTALREQSPELWPRVSPSGVRTRLNELVREGLVEAVPDTLGRSAAGNGAHLWRLTR